MNCYFRSECLRERNSFFCAPHCHHLLEGRKEGRGGGQRAVDLVCLQSKEGKQVDEEVEEEGRLRLLSLSLARPHSLRALAVECSAGDRAVRVRWLLSLIRVAHSQSSVLRRELEA